MVELRRSARLKEKSQATKETAKQPTPARAQPTSKKSRPPKIPTARRGKKRAAEKVADSANKRRRPDVSEGNKIQDDSDESEIEEQESPVSFWDSSENGYNSNQVSPADSWQQQRKKGPGPRDVVYNFKIPGFSLDGRPQIRTKDQVNNFLAASNFPPELRPGYHDMSKFRDRRGRWIPFPPKNSKPMMQRNPANKISIKLKMPPRRAENIVVHNLAGCTFIAVVSKTGMKAVHLWESYGLLPGEKGERALPKGHRKILSGPRHAKQLEEMLEENIIEFFREEADMGKLEDGRVIVVLPRWRRIEANHKDNQVYRYDMMPYLLLDESHHVMPMVYRFSENVPKFIKWAVAEGTGLHRDCGITEEKDDGTVTWPKNFFEVKYWPRESRIPHFKPIARDGMDPQKPNRQGTFVLQYDPHHEKDGKKCTIVRAWMDGIPIFNQDGKHPEEELIWDIEH